MAKLQQFTDFGGQTIYVGIDTHLKNWDIAVHFNKQFIRAFHQQADPKALETTLKRDYPNAFIECAYEAGFSGFWLQRYLTGKGIKCIVVNAADVPQTDKERKSKTDRRDSRRIAQSLEAGQLQAIHVPNEQCEGDRKLTRYRQQVLQDLIRSKNRIKSLLYQQGIEIPDRFKKNNWSKIFIVWLRELKAEHPLLKYTLDLMITKVEILRNELLMLNKNVKDLLETKQYEKSGALLMSVPGIGPITAMTLLAEINDISRFPTFLHFNSFIGLCPGEHTSGEDERKGHIINRQHRILRALFIEAAWKAIKTDPALLLTFSELKKRMTGKRAIIKIARKLLNRVYHVWIKEEAYEKGIKI